MNSDLKVFETATKLSEYFASILREQVISSESKINFALSGGSTPKNIFKLLANNYRDSINWNKINFFWSDERCVPPDDDESNYKMAYDNLLSKISVPEENVFRIKGENDSEVEAKNYSEQIRTVLPQKNQLPQFDLIMLGLGEDGHTASIFPDQIHLLNANNVCSIATHPITKQKRITFAGKVINNARNIVFIVTGNNKSKIVDDILNQKEDSKSYPASFIKPINGNLFWLLDKEAASLLKGY